LALIFVYTVCSCLSIGEFGRSWIKARKNIGKKRRADYLATIAVLERHFGAGALLRDVTVGAANAFRDLLVSEGYAIDTVGWRVKMAKCLFAAAVDYKHLLESPFAKVRAGSKSTNDRFVYVEKGDIDAIIDDVSCPQWKAMITLWRMDRAPIAYDSSTFTFRQGSFRRICS
jgi:hypothetical protein